MCCSFVLGRGPPRARCVRALALVYYLTILKVNIVKGLILAFLGYRGCVLPETGVSNKSNYDIRTRIQTYNIADDTNRQYR